MLASTIAFVAAVATILCISLFVVTSLAKEDMAGVWAIGFLASLLTTIIQTSEAIFQLESYYLSRK